ncbi:ead/Ea22-like family protein [Escherichia coli]|uniref:ead/Ea22-like family protein n=1 Tax=Escherichia coli TaxID=562 RepID=UPI000BE8DEAA|nr:ead/Ea22-like family protein [Escherichia coli]EFE9119467.1 ead/Ea22-like family protein [Escherichia coli]
MSEINYQALRKAAQNYQSTLAWYQEKPDSPNAEQDCDAALAAFKREICHREVDIIAGLLDELDEKQQYIKLSDQENKEIALTVWKLRVELEEAKSKLNEQREYYERVISDGSKRIAEQEAREIKPAKGEVLVVVSGFTGCGKSAIAGEIEIAMKAIGVPVQWTNGDAEKRMTGADWLTAIEMYKPTVRIVEVNVPRADGISIKGEEHGNKTRR